MRRVPLLMIMNHLLTILSCPDWHPASVKKARDEDNFLRYLLRTTGTSKVTTTWSWRERERIASQD